MNWLIPGVGYDTSAPLWHVLWATVSHLSLAHLASNVALFAIGAAVLHRWGELEDGLPALPAAPAAVFAFGVLAGPVRGASGGTLVLIGAAAYLGLLHRPRLTAPLLVAFGLHQAAFATPVVAWAHAVAFLLGFVWADYRRMWWVARYSGLPDPLPTDVDSRTALSRTAPRPRR